jgi:pimeloyl-ACP methyl ester carboxylesterase
MICYPSLNPTAAHFLAARKKCRFAASAFLFLLLLGTSGCTMGRLAANQILTAPNLRQPTNSYSSFWTNFTAREPANPLLSATIPVGPPAAQLSAVVLPARDYHWSFVTKVETNKGSTQTLLLHASWETNGVFKPLAEPATIVLLHGYGMTKESMVAWVFLLAQAGYRVVAIDLRGHGDSTGARVGFGTFEAADLTQALDYLIAHKLCDERVGVLGLSYGATMALHWAARDPRVRTVVSIAPYNRPGEAVERFAEMFLKVKIPKKVIQAGVAGAASKLGVKWSDWSAETSLRRIRQPVLFISGGKDTICRREDIAALTKAAGGKAKGLEIPEAHHILLGAWMHGLIEPVKTWLAEHLGNAPPRS